MVGNWEEARMVKKCEYGLSLKHKERTQEMLSGKGESLGEGRDCSGLERIVCFLSDVQDSWVGTWLNQPQEATLVGSLPNLSSTLQDMTSDSEAGR